MDPAQIKNATVDALQAAIVSMTSPAFEVALIGQPDDVVQSARRERGLVQMARVALENSQLATIADQLTAQDDALRIGRQRLMAAMQDLQKVQSVIAAVGSFVDLISHVVLA